MSQLPSHRDCSSDLYVYFEELEEASLREDFDYNQFLCDGHLPLLAKLVHDSQVPLYDLLPELRAILLPVGSHFERQGANWTILSGTISAHFTKASYGHPEAGNNFSALSCTFWQVKDMTLLGEEIGRHFVSSFVLRQAARMILESRLTAQESEAPTAIALATETPVTELKTPLVANSIASGISAMSIASNHQSGTATPVKKEREQSKEPREQKNAKGGRESKEDKESKENRDGKETITPATAPSNPNSKISSFFTKLKKPEREGRVDRIPGEYFQPFFVKPGVNVTSLDALRDLKVHNVGMTTAARVQLDEISNHAAYWRAFRMQAVRIAQSRARRTCLCVGLDGRASRAVLKLLKFDENHRPAYLGTWRKTAPAGSCSGRRPFARLPEADYEYDSDQEWEEEDAEGEGESLSSISNEDEEEDQDLGSSADESEEA